MQPTPPAAARAKTHRRRGPSTPAIDTPGPFVSDSVAKSTEDSLDALFAAESAANFNQPWQKLDRGSRLDRLRRFVQTYPDLSPAERASLLSAILSAFEARQLNTKASVDYDPATATVTGVRGLKDRVSSSTGLRIFRIDPTAVAAAAAASTRTTHKRKVATTAAVAAAVAATPTPTLVSAGAGAGAAATANPSTV
jgi:hypothetical protein